MKFRHSSRSVFSLVSLALSVAGIVGIGACASKDAETFPPGLGPGGPLDGGAEAAKTKPDGAPLDDSGTTDEPAVCTADKSPGTQKHACEGFDVSVTVPASCPSAGCGLILDLHGALMNGDAQDAHTELRARGGAKGFVVVQPTASTRTYSGFSGPQWFNADDDALFRLVTALVRDLALDHSRIHVTGFSQGGFAALRLMCKHADTFASIAAGAAGTNGCPLDESIIATCSMTGTDKPSRPLDVLFLYGRKDAVVPPSCAEGMVDAIVKGFSLGAPQTLADDGSYTKKRYASKTGAGANIVLDTFAHDYETSSASSLSFNKGHCYPGSKANSGSVWDDLKCDGTNAFAWGTEVANFFAAHPRP